MTKLLSSSFSILNRDIVRNQCIGIDNVVYEGMVELIDSEVDGNSCGYREG
jgi:hypothetical protein